MKASSISPTCWGLQTQIKQAASQLGPSNPPLNGWEIIWCAIRTEELETPTDTKAGMGGGDGTWILSSVQLERSIMEEGSDLAVADSPTHQQENQQSSAAQALARASALSWPFTHKE
jgi:hypothetical protein